MITYNNIIINPCIYKRFSFQRNFDSRQTVAAFLNLRISLHEYDASGGKRSHIADLITIYDVVHFAERRKLLCCSYCKSNSNLSNRVFFFLKGPSSKTLRIKPPVADGILLCSNSSINSSKRSHCQKSLAPLHLPVVLVGPVIESILNVAVGILENYQTKQQVQEFQKMFGIDTEPLFGYGVLISKKWKQERLIDYPLRSPCVDKIYRFGTMNSFCAKWKVKQSERPLKYDFSEFPETSIYLPDLEPWFEALKEKVREAALNHQRKKILFLNYKENHIPYLEPHLLNKIYAFAFTPVLQRSQEVIQEDKLMRYKNIVWFLTPLKKRQAMLQLCHMLYHEVKGRDLFLVQSRATAVAELKLKEIKLTVGNALKKGRIKKIIME